MDIIAARREMRIKNIGMVQKSIEKALKAGVWTEEELIPLELSLVVDMAIPDGKVRVKGTDRFTGNLTTGARREWDLRFCSLATNSRRPS